MFDVKSWYYSDEGSFRKALEAVEVLTALRNSRRLSSSSRFPRRLGIEANKEPDGEVPVLRARRRGVCETRSPSGPGACTREHVSVQFHADQQGRRVLAWPAGPFSLDPRRLVTFPVPSDGKTRV